MKRLSVMLLAGEASGDTLAAELVQALRVELAEFQSRPTADVQPLYASLTPQFFGAGGAKMAAVGVELAVDLTAHAVFGFADVLKKYAQFRRLFRQSVRLAVQRQPDVIICVDFSGFNRRFARAVKNHVRAQAGPFHTWRPKMVQFVSPQVWASRAGRAQAMARDLDLLLSIFPFEKAWYAGRVPALKVEFVGHPMFDRYMNAECGMRNAESGVRSAESARLSPQPCLVLLPGSRVKELKQHLPVMVEAAKQIQAQQAVSFCMVLPNEALADTARSHLNTLSAVQVQVGGLAEALASAELALASSGTVTMECAFFGVPAVVLYKLSWPEFQLARRIVRVRHIAMPNLLAGEAVYPEFIQAQATPERLARAALEMLNDEARRQTVKAKLAGVVASLGGPGAARRAAQAIVRLLA